MKKLILIIGSFVALVAAIVYFLLPGNIKWDKYIQEALADVQRRTGLTLAIQGSPVFSMKPTASLKLGQIRLGNVKDGTYPQMMTADGAEILFDTSSVFRRTIKVKKIILSSPRFYFETMPDGKWNWQIAFFDKAGRDASVGFESLMLNGGTAEIKTDKYSPVQQWERINAELFADSIQGPFFFEGNFGAASTSFNFSLKVEKIVNGQSPVFSVRLINAPAETTASFEGRYGLSESDRGTLTGSVTFDVRKPDRFFALIYPQDNLPASFFQPLEGSMKVKKSAQTRTTEMTDILFKYGESSATGRLSIRKLSPQEASVLQAKEEADEEEEEIVLRDPRDPTKVVKLEETPVLQTKMAANLLPKVVDGSFVFSKLDGNPFFAGLPDVAEFLSRQGIFSKTKDSYSLKLMFDTVNYKKDAIHQLGMQVKSVNGGLEFNDFSATLPGDGYTKGNALLSLTGRPVLSGNVSAEGNNLGLILKWLNLPVAEEIPQTLLHHFSVSADFKAVTDGIVLKQAKGSVDKTDFSGDFSWRGGKRQVFNVSADISDLNLAEYFPEGSKAFIQKKEAFSQLSERDKVADLFKNLIFLNNFDLKVRLAGKTFSWADINAEKFKTDFSLVRGQMKIKEFTADRLFSSAVSVHGGVEGFGMTPKFDKFSINLDTRQLSSLQQSVGVELPQGLSSQDKLKLSAKLSGTLMMMDFDLSADFGTSRFAGQGIFKETGGGYFDWNADVEIYHENFRNFVRLFTDAYRPVLANPGALTLKAQMFKNKELFNLTNMQAKIGDNDFVGFFKLNRQEKVPVINAEISGENMVLFGMLPQARFSDIVSIDTRKVVPENFWEKDGVLTRFAKDLTFTQKPFDFSFLGKYDATVAVKAKNLFFNSFVLSDFDGLLKVTEDGVSIDLRRSLWNGSNFGGMATFTPVGDTLSVKGALRISNIDIPARLFDADTLNLSNVEDMVLNLNFSGNGKTFSSMMEALAGTGSLGFEKADLLRFDYERFSKDLSSPQMSAEDIEKDALTGVTKVNKFLGEVNLKDGLFLVRPASFLYNGAKNETPAFSYDYKTQVLKAAVSFPIDVEGVPPVSLNVKRTLDRSAELTHNIADVVKGQRAFDHKQQEKKQQAALQQRQQEKAEWEKARKLQKERLNELESKVTLASAEMSKKLEVVRAVVANVYQLHKYQVDFEKVEAALFAINEEIQQKKYDLDISKDVADEDIGALEQKLKTEYFDKENELNAAYNIVSLAESKGLLFDFMKRSEDVLRESMKQLTFYPDNTEIAETVEEMKVEFKKIQDANSQAEAEGLAQEGLMALAGQAEAGYEKIKTLQKKTEQAVNREKEKERAEEEARRDLEELRKEEEEAARKAEEEARKAAEAAAAAEKERQEAEIRERQRTIVRKDGVYDASAGKGGTATLQPVLNQAEQSDQNRTETQTEKPSILRRR